MTKLTLIGQFAATGSDGGSLTIPPSGARLLALLAFHRHGVTRGCAGGILWPEKGEERASANLRSTLWRLKSTRSVTIVDREPTVLCLSPDIDVDLDDVVSDDPSNNTVETLLHDLLEGWDDPWVDPFRTRWRQTRLHIVDQRCRQLIDEEHYGSAVALAKRVLTIEPLRESMVRLLVEAALALNHPAAAVAAIDGYEARLNEELGAKASPKIRDLATAIAGGLAAGR